MKYRKTKKYICILTAVFLWFSGICFGVNLTGSVFACKKIPLSADQTLYSLGTSVTRELCAPTTLGQRTISSPVSSTQRASRRNLTHYENILTTEKHLSACASSAYKLIITDVGRHSGSHAMIVQYIHHQDGQK